MSGGIAERCLRVYKKTYRTQWGKGKMFKQDTLTLSPHLSLPCTAAAAIDIGGSLCKCAYVRPRKTISEQGEAVTVQLVTVQLVTVALGDLGALLEHLRDVNVTGPDSRVTVTGMSVRHALMTQIETALGVSVESAFENTCQQSGFLHLVTRCCKGDVVLPGHAAAARLAAHVTSLFARACKTHRTAALPPPPEPSPSPSPSPSPNVNGKGDVLSYVRADPELFPCLLVTYGSGATFSLITNEEVSGCRVVDGSPRGGKSFMALASLLLGTQDYEEVLSLAAQGSDQHLSQYMADLRNGATEPDAAFSLFPDQMLIYYLGKVVGKNTDDFHRADLARAIVSLCAGEVSHVSYWVAKASQCKRVFFCGGLLDHPLMQEEVTKAFLARSLFHSDTAFPEHFFMRHTSYLAALGGLLLGSNPGKEKSLD